MKAEVHVLCVTTVAEVTGEVPTATALVLEMLGETVLDLVPTAALGALER